MEPRKLSLKVVVVLAAAVLGPSMARAIPPGFKFCVQYCPTSPPYAFQSCWIHCYLEWCRSNVPPQYREGCKYLLYQPALAAGLIARDSGNPGGYEVDSSGVAYFDFTGRSDLHLSAVDLREQTNPAQSITVWYLPGGKTDSDWSQVGKGIPSAAGGWDLLVAFDSTSDGPRTGTLAFEVVRQKPSDQDAAFALCPVLHSSAVTFDGLSNYAMGDAVIAVEEDDTGARRLPVRNLGSSGQDGVSIDLRSSGSKFRPAFFDVFFEVAPDTSSDASLHARVAQGDVDGDGIDEVLANAQADAAPGGVDLKVRFPWLPAALDTGRTIEMFLGGEQVGAVKGVQGESAGRAVSAAGSPSPWPKDIHIHFDPFYIEFTWTGKLSSDARLAASAGADIALDGQLVHCDRLRITPEGVSPPRSKLSSFTMTASGIGSITLTGESVRPSEPVVLDGIAHNALGDATLSIEDDGTGERRLPVRNLGSSGEDGVSIDLGSTRRFRPAFFDVFVDLAVADPTSSQLDARVVAADLDGDGKSDLAAEASATGTDAGIELRNSFPWAPADAPVTLSYSLGSTPVGKSKSTNGAVAGLVVGDPSDPSSKPIHVKDIHIQFLDHYPWIVITITFSGRGGSTERGAGASAGAWVQIDGVPVLIDRLDMSPDEGSLAGLSGLESLDLTAAGISEIVITGENIGELPATPTFRRGDANGDSRVDIGDAIFLLGYMFSGTKAPACMDSADVNDTGEVDLSDPISALNYLFLGAKAPPAPGASACGADPTADTLACDAYSACP